MRSENNFLNEHSRITSVSSMEDLVINAKEYKLLKKFKRRLQEQFKVEIQMPKGPSSDSDIMFVSIHGDEKNRDFVKNFLSEKMKKLEKKNAEKVPVITLSDSEGESSSELDDSVIEVSAGVPSKPVNTVTLDDSVCILEASIPSQNKVTLDDSVCILGTPIPLENNLKNKKRLKRKRKRVSSAAVELSTNDVTDKRDKKRKFFRKQMIISPSVCAPGRSIDVRPAVEFIPLQKENKCTNHPRSQVKHVNDIKAHIKTEVHNDDEIIVIAEPSPVVKSQPLIPVTPRKLRPIVIDGSNVAREHGKASHSFSVKGIKIAIDYFLNRGHTQVTTFVPLFRKSNNANRVVPTTDSSILDELEKKQLVVFTPSRRVNDKYINCYDDRYIVKLAAANGGVVVSNDNYRDLVAENESYREAIEKRLLMFCFVGDMFMVPDDPLGRTGPSLSDFLSFPPDDQNK